MLISNHPASDEGLLAEADNGTADIGVNLDAEKSI